MRRSNLWSLAILIAFAGCAAPPMEKRIATATNDAVAAYKRSKPVAPPTPPFQDFGFIESDTLTLQLNATLTDRQTRQQCDQKPVEAVMVPPKRIRRCVRAAMYNLQGCSQYEELPGEGQPTCLVPCPTCSTGILTCAKRADPNEPTLGYRYTQDCYATPAAPEALGRVGVYAVPEDARITGPGNPGRLLWSTTLTRDGKPQSVRLANAVRPGECLALVDGEGNPIPVRDRFAGSEVNLFATAQMRADNARAALQAKSEREQQTVAGLRADVDRARQAVLQSVAWNNDRCVAPQRRPLPPEPTGLMPAAEIEASAMGYCTATLTAQISVAMVAEALVAEQEHDYRLQYNRLRGDGANAPRCTWKSHTFDPVSVSMLRGGTEAVSQLGGFDRLPSSPQELVALFGTHLQSNTMSQQRRNTLIVGMLAACKADAIRACEGPRRAWRTEVNRIQAEPQQVLQQCESSLQRFQQASAAFKAAEQSAALAADALRTANASGSPERARLSEALCRTQ